MKRLLALVLLLVLAFLFRLQLLTGARATLFILDVFPQVPVKPLGWITRTPRYRHVSFPTSHGEVIADLFLPRPWFGSPAPHSEPAIIVAQGVKIPPGARSGFLHLGQTLARLGYVVLFPQLRTLATGHTGLEVPDTYVRSFAYLQGLREVDPHRISYAGFSVGSSVALVGAADPRINHQVHALIFFAGYYDIFDYLVSVATRHDPYQGQAVAWQPDPSAIKQTKAILKDKGATSLLRVFTTHRVAEAERVLHQANPADLRRMQRYNPAAHIHHYHAPTFILEDQHDTFVPYVESEKLAAALPRTQIKAMLLTNLFHHVMPGQGGLARLAGGFFSLYGFLYQALSFL